MTEKVQIWNRIQSLLPEVFGQTVYKGWLKFLSFEEDLGSRLLLSVPSPFIRDWITTRYLNQIVVLWQKEDPSLQSIEIIAKGPDKQDLIDNPNISTEAQETSGDALDNYLLKNSTGGLDPRFTFENFVVGKPNELAYAAAQRVAESNKVYFNPLFLYGGVGLGKTHLMHAVAWKLHHTQPNRRVIYMSAEKFMYQFIRALRHKTIINFREQLRSVDILMIDDVQFISGKDSTQEEFFHTFNSLVDQKRQIILSADKSPSEMQGIEERMRSRLGWGLVADIHPSTYELRLGILQSKAENLPVPIPSDVLEFLAHKVTSNIRELEGALNRIMAHATLVGSDISLEKTQELLKDLLRANERYVTVEEIQRHVAEHYNIRVSDMHSSKRSRTVARPRQVAMYLSKQLTSRSLPEIGRKFGGRDHTTVMHAVKAIKSLQETDLSLRDDVTLLEKMLGH
ncbi:MAG: chromosomal replication initiator protein DnaA [Alphaproteobacteria bacterium]